MSPCSEADLRSRSLSCWPRIRPQMPYIQPAGWAGAHPLCSALGDEPPPSSPAGRTLGCSWVTQSPQRWMCHEHQGHDLVREQPAGTSQTSLPQACGTGGIRRQHPKNTFPFLYPSIPQNGVSISSLQTSDLPRDAAVFLAAISDMLKLTDAPAGPLHP